MPKDLIMCINEFCPKKEKCYRYTAPPDEFNQPYEEFSFLHTDRDVVECEQFINNKHQGNRYEKL